MTKSELHPFGAFRMVLLAVLVGIITGLGAVVFRYMIGFVHNLMFLGQLNFIYDANVHTPPSPWGAGVILVPMIGAVVVAWLVKNFAPEAKGHGVPEVIEAIYYKEGIIKPIVALIKSIASSISIGTGGSVGREGPIIQIGSAFASTVGQILPIPPRQRVILIAAGAGAGIAATFNAPIGGLAFAIELMLVSVNASSVLVVATSTATATYIGRYFLGLAPSFNIPALATPDLHLEILYTLLLFIPLGLIIGLASTLFIRSIYWFEDRFDSIPGTYYTRHVLGMFFVGVLIYTLMRFSGHYYVQGIGYATIVDVLKFLITNPWLLILLFALKLLSTSLTLGSGASGGIFSPSLFLGATLGGAFGLIVKILFPGLGIDPVVFAVAGMAGMISGTTGAVVTAIAMTFEQTRDYNAILPIMICVGLSYAVRKYLSNESIYTMKLLRRGSVVPEGLDAAISHAIRAKEVMNELFHVIPFEKLKLDMVHVRRPEMTLVEDSGRILGVLRYRPMIKGKITRENLDEFIDDNFIVVSPFADLVTVMRMMQAKEVSAVIVSNRSNTKDVTPVIGTISPEDVANSLGRAAKLM